MSDPYDRVAAPEPSEPGLAWWPSLRGTAQRLAQRWHTGTLDILTANAAPIRLHGRHPGPAAVLKLHHAKMLRRLGWSGDIGFAESYIAGEWDTPDLRALLHAATLNLDGTDLLHGAALSRLLGALQHWRNRNSLAGARRNIRAHYDLGNRFYSRWLDHSMSYSAGLFETPSSSLAAAQRSKYAALAQRIGLLPGHSLLEIGCGWGAFAEFAAGDIGAKVTAITLSPAQFQHVCARMQKAGLNHRVKVALMDYRTITGWFDRVVSIEMIEAVGERYWPTYFRKLAEVLAPGGIAGLQAITIDNGRFENYRKRADFIQRYVFPGGMLPCESRLASEAAKAGLAWNSIFRFGEHYGRTLQLWAENFAAAWPEIAQMGFDERFRRLWSYYLAYCEAGFRSKQIDVVHLALHKI